MLDVLADIFLGSAYAASAVSALPNNGLYGSVTSSLIISAWALGFTLNVSVTGAIVARLWQMGRTMASLTATSNNRFMSTIYVVVESGAIFAAANLFALALYASNSPVSVIGLDIASQLAVCVHSPFFLFRALSRFILFRQALTPLLIVVQVGLTGRYHIPNGDSVKTVFTAQHEIVFRMGVPREQDSWQA